MESITSMILISLQPFNYRKICAVVAALICLSSVSCFAQNTFLSVASTPYDRQMSRIQTVLFTKSSPHQQNLPLAVVNHWIQDLRGIPYGFTPQWRTPAEVQTAPVADCKGKAVALYGRMRSNGAQNLRLVIGKRSSSSRKTHAWLEWSTDGGTYVLDPTINWAASRVEQYGTGSYIPLYAYAGARKFRAATSTLLAKN